MKIRTTPDIVELEGEELLEILAAAVLARTGRRLSHINWVNVVDRHVIGFATPQKLVHLNAMLHPPEAK